jgi:hypothetical protein
MKDPALKDRAVLACLLLCWLPLGAAGQAVIMNFNNNLQVFGNNNNVKPEKLPEPHGDVLEFVDGSSLHGSLARMDLEHGLGWNSPLAGGPISFRPDHIAFLRFSHAKSLSMTPTCHVWFANGDDLYGSISSLDDQRLGFNTWFGGSMVLPRAAVRAITFLSSNYSVLYEGPYDTGGWEVVNNTSKSWTFHDNAFICNGTGMLGREMNLSNSTTLEFDVAWNGTFHLEIGLYCDVMDHLEFNSGSCAVGLTPQTVSVSQVQNMGLPFGMASVPLPTNIVNSRMRVAIECDKAEGAVSVFVNRQLIKTWKDCNFSGGGTGVMFAQLPNYVGGGTVKLSHLKISQWEGRCEPQTSSPPTNSDAMHFVNHDRAAGKIQSIMDGKVKLEMAGRVLDIPLGRVTQMEFAEDKVPSEAPGPWQVRAHFPGGGSVSFQLEKWDEKAVAGQSAIFGSLAFQPDAIREMEFNLNRPKEEGVAAQTKEFEELDE